MIKNLLTLFLLLIFGAGFCQDHLQLAPPLLTYPSAFFTGSTQVQLRFRQPGAEIRYTLDGKEPTRHDLLYSDPITIITNCTLKARSFAKAFDASETVTASFFKDGKKIRGIEFSKPNPAYTNSGKDVLHDNLGGMPDFHNQNWLGFNVDTVDVWVHLQKKETIQSVLLNFLVDQQSWIFLPEKILLYGYDDLRRTYLKMGEETYESDQFAPRACSAQTIKLAKQFATSLIHLRLCTMKKMPDWHVSKGEHAHLFMDELKVY
ncbi:chitobiase/beta-hexosaminidase C-terminal domain-containing protein [Pedobacter insulae]|uniref:Chitobiase/beta-hexosaminidase C-terminal domain-containing protein n=1 Tax=Pedobacter insulae TaxID=414048 RepID=A0A1I2YIW7_9SPHI|nr:chitobiase/beta-hexosaminidase C-terminal domain-containing protein [Pedobacter insulae]SFH25633.1 Chitobiase/beta-hexosaminidase C-terminal domain-containing protein [Pedobacter insulae]